MEGAYYELVFQSGPATSFPSSADMRKTLFNVHVRSERGLQLHRLRSKPLKKRLRDQVDTRFAQASGRRMREAGIEAFEYHSARSV